MNPNTPQDNQLKRLGPVRHHQQWSKLGIVGTLLTRAGQRVTRKKTLGVFATIGRAPRLFRGWLHFSATMMPFGYLIRQEPESVILRVAYLRHSDYELDQHRVIAAKAGLSTAMISAIESPFSPAETRRQRAMMTAVDELVLQRELSDDTYSQLASKLKEKELAAFIMLVTNYDGLATTLVTLGVPVDEDR